MGKYMFVDRNQPKTNVPQIDVDKLVSIQASKLREEYKTDCLNMKQLQQVLNVGESNVYLWAKKM